MKINEINNHNFQGLQVPNDLIGQFPVSNPKDSFTLLATNSVFLVRSANPFTPSPQDNLMIWKQLQQPSTQPTKESAQENRQYFNPLTQLSVALLVSPHLQSIQRGAHHVQQHASQQRYASPQAQIECHQSMQQAVLQAAYEHHQHWQHFLRKSILDLLINQLLIQELVDFNLIVSIRNRILGETLDKITIRSIP